MNGVRISSEVLALPVRRSPEVTSPSRPRNALSRELLGPSLIGLSCETTMEAMSE